MLISTGVTDIDDIDELIKILKNKKNKKVSLLHCVSLYPTKNEEINLSRIAFINNRYIIIAGFSDHTIGDEATVAQYTMEQNLENILLLIIKKMDMIIKFLLILSNLTIW